MTAIRPYLKAVQPALLALIAVAVQLAVTGEYDAPELATTVTGLLSSLLVFLVSNQEPVIVPLDIRPPADLKVDKAEPNEKARRRVR